MTEEQFIVAVEALGLRIEPSVDTSAAGEYAVILRSRSGGMYGDDAPVFDVLAYDLYYVAPLSFNRTAICDQLRMLVFEHFGVHPREEDLSDATGQIYHYTFSAIGGISHGAL